MATRWKSKPSKIRVSDISYGNDDGFLGMFFNGPDKRGERTDKWGKKPIDVKPHGGGYKVIDGNDRLYYAKQRGDTHIQAIVWEETSEQDKPAKKRGLLYWE